VLKFVFWILVGLNAVVFAVGHGYLGNFKGEEHEPARLKNQIEPSRLKMVTPEQAQPAASAPAAASAAAPATEPAAAPAAAAVACAEVGPLSASDARRFETRVARLDLGGRETHVSVPFQEVTSRLVYIPGQGSKEAAERKAAELRALGLTNFFIISGDSPYKWGISLGLFKAEASAQAMLASLVKQGVRSARIAPRGPVTNRTVYQFRGIDAGTRARIVEIADRYDSAEVRACK
jgi:pyruvate/2-oxoglutarate dehydrogenase complex dihydrolipoamide acyltransferase (E2) component